MFTQCPFNPTVQAVSRVQIETTAAVKSRGGEKEAFKNAAAEICDLLSKVRKQGASCECMTYASLTRRTSVGV